MRHLERSILLQVIDNRWREHLFDMDYLREGIHLRGFAQIDPLVAYKNEGFIDVRRPHALDLGGVLETRLPRRDRIHRSRRAARFQGGGFEAGTGRRALDYSGGTAEAQPSALEQVAAGAGPAPRPRAAPSTWPPRRRSATGGDVVETVVKDEHDKLGRNDPCWCGSGKKYKKCHG